MTTGTMTQDTLDDALDRLTGYGYVDGAGLACHGPMGAEALSALGHHEVVPDWVEAYKVANPPIEPPPAARPVDPADKGSWRSALGDFSRVSDWAVLFRQELQERPWSDVVKGWAPRLLPGYGGGLTHGLLRVAHTVRAVGVDGQPSDLALEELAKGLAAWTGWYTELPGRPRPSGSLTLEDAIASLPRPEERWSPMEAGTFSRLGELTSFPDAVDALQAPEQAEAALGDLTAGFCRLLVARPEVMPMGLVHAVTPVAAVRSLLPLLPGVATEAIHAQLWQVGAGLVSGFVPEPASGASAAPPVEQQEPPSPETLAARAVEHRDPHVVKFTEACLREHADRPDPAYLLAAATLTDKMPTW